VLPAAVHPMLPHPSHLVARIARSVHPVQQIAESGAQSDEPDAEVVELSHGVRITRMPIDQRSAAVSQFDGSGGRRDDLERREVGPIA
jgi:hypothetical protein